MITFRVLGVPAPQGSKTVVGHGGGRSHAIEGGSKTGRARLRSWRTAVAETARDIFESEQLPAPLDGPLELTVRFRMPMPASRPKRLRLVGQGWHSIKPDGSKLLRSTEDALTDAGLIRDDARICRFSVEKIEVIGWTGATISVGPINGMPRGWCWCSDCGWGDHDTGDPICPVEEVDDEQGS
jgi:Holliday junction resolvase RusA-like endonuclease